jgi:hypothetical protein
LKDEEIVILGGESDAAQDFEAADSVTGFGAEDLAALGAQDIADLAAFTPNLEIVTAGATTPTFFIRGVGLNDFNSNSTGAVAIYQDDVPINAPALQLSTLYDMEAVNVLRGPQGTGLARNASAGAIKSTLADWRVRLPALRVRTTRVTKAPSRLPFEDILVGRFFRLDETAPENCCGERLRRRSARPAQSRSGAGLENPSWSICGEQQGRLGIRGSPIAGPRPT